MFLLCDNQNGINVYSKSHLTSLVIFIACCLLYGTFICLIQTEQNGNKEPNPFRNNFNQSLNDIERIQINNSSLYQENIKYYIHSYTVNKNVLTNTQRDIFESPNIEFLPQFKSACFYDQTNSRYLCLIEN